MSLIGANYSAQAVNDYGMLGFYPCLDGRLSLELIAVKLVNFLQLFFDDYKMFNY